MARSLVFGNGRLHVGLDECGLVHDLYFPYVGLENHCPPGALAHKIGIYVDGSLSWLDSGDWTFSMQYHAKSMLGNSTATNTALGVRLELTDCVDVEADVFIRNIHVINLRSDTRQLKLFCHQAFMIGESASSDSVQYRPDKAAIMHYKGNRVFLVGLESGGRMFDDFSVGKYDLTNGDGTYRDAEDGLLAKNMVENGRTDSVMGILLELEAVGSTRAFYSLVAAESVAEAESIHDVLASDGVMHYLARTAAYWQQWVSRAAVSPRLPQHYRDRLETSLFVIKAHIDSRGAVMASLDSSLRNHPQDDAYNFCWPRDAAYALWPLLRLGYTDELESFFDFIVRGLHEDGYVYHKYRADGSLGSTWLPYTHADGTIHPPIQADETAVVLFLLGQYHRQSNSQELLVKYYTQLVEPMANFLAGYTAGDGLPLPSYDLWEHSYLTHTYTTAVTYASLVEASEMADAYGRSDDGARWRAAAEAMKSAAACLFNPDTGYFYKGFLEDASGNKIFDPRLDSSSLFGVFMFRLFEIESEEFTRSRQTATQHLCENGVGWKRLEGDDYYGNAARPNVWPVISLWMTQIALELDEIDLVEKGLEFVLSLESSSGMLPEQVDPESHHVTSLSPLVWSHAELASTLIDYMQVKKA